MPRRIPLGKYADGPIPLRALQIASHALPMFDAIEVWCPGVGERDPLLVGIRGGSAGWGEAGRFGGDRFILARWGDVLDDFETLRSKARTKIVARLASACAQAKGELTLFEAAVPAHVDAYLQGQAPAGVNITLGFAR